MMDVEVDIFGVGHWSCLPKKANYTFLGTTYFGDILCMLQMGNQTAPEFSKSKKFSTARDVIQPRKHR